MTATMAVLAILGVPVMLGALSILRGWALCILWAWFVAPTFGVAELSIPIAIGISLVVGMLTSNAGRIEEDQKHFGQKIFAAFLTPLVGLGIGWIVLRFV